MRLVDKVALVTGAASGIGQATVRRFVAEGAAAVVAADLNRDGLAETASGLQRVTAMPLDITDSGAVNAAFAEVDRLYGRLDVLVNAAGIGSASPESGQRVLEQAAASIETSKRGETVSPHWDITTHITDADFARGIAVNLTGPFYCVRAAIPIMTRSGGGSIVNVSSVSALVGHPMPAYYPASKAGLLGMTRSVAGELADRGIRVNAVCPGATDTPMLRANRPEIVEMLIDLQPIRRAASADEMAATILFLASDEAAFYTGQTLSPNGGMWM